MVDGLDGSGRVGLDWTSWQWWDNLSSAYQHGFKMGIQDRDYMRNRTVGDAFADGRRRRPPRDWFRILAIAGAAIGVASAGLWFLRDISRMLPSVGPAEGSLVVNINTASQAELETVPGIGPTRAAQIIAGRPYDSVDALERLSGIGPNQVAEMRPFLTTQGKASADTP